MPSIENLKLKIGNSFQELSHAYLIEGGYERTRTSLFGFFEKGLGMDIHGNPDIFEHAFETFGIDDSRALKEMQSKRGIGKNGRFFVIYAESFTGEAQNALLKTFEEPAEDVHFFIVVPNADVLLPTLQSRFLRISAEEGAAKDETSDARKLALEFASSKPHERLNIVKPMVEEKDKKAAMSFLSELEYVFSKDASGTSDKASKDFLKEVIKYKGYLHARGSSVKMVLEALALLAP